MISEFDEAANVLSEDVLKRSTRQVLIPSELVSVRFGEGGGEYGTLQADLVNISHGGCCLVVARKLSLAIGSPGELERTLADTVQRRHRRFEVRWMQDLGEMMEIGLQFTDN